MSKQPLYAHATHATTVSYLREVKINFLSPNLTKAKSMKKILVLLAVLFACVQMGFAQDYTEVVYLKNGSIIKGTVIEQVPGVSIKIQTGDGSVFAYNMSEVEKITKEQAQTYENNYGGYSHSSSYSSKSKSSKSKHAGNGIQPGARWFVDLIGAFGDDTDAGVSFVGGYQINKLIFVGLGVAGTYYFDSEIFEVPIFADVRCDILDSYITPFVDFRIGYTVYDYQGLYLTPSVGCRFGNFNVSLGYFMQKMDWDGWDVQEDGVMVKIGWDF